MIGGTSTRAALDGETVKMCALQRVADDPYEVHTKLIDVKSVANQVRHVPAEWISADGMGVTEEFLRYVRPLVGDMPEQLPPLP